MFTVTFVSLDGGHLTWITLFPYRTSVRGTSVWLRLFTGVQSGKVVLFTNFSPVRRGLDQTKVPFPGTRRIYA